MISQQTFLARRQVLRFSVRRSRLVKRVQQTGDKTTGSGDAVSDDLFVVRTSNVLPGRVLSSDTVVVVREPAVEIRICGEFDFAGDLRLTSDPQISNSAVVTRRAANRDPGVMVL